MIFIYLYMSNCLYVHITLIGKYFLQQLTFSSSIYFFSLTNASYAWGTYLILDGETSWAPIKMQNIFPHAMFENDDFIWKFKNGSYQNGLNLLFGKSKIFKFEFGSNFTIVFKIVKVENLRMTTQTLSFSNSLFMISQLKSII